MVELAIGIPLGQRGQEFAVYRLLIGAILALLILLIIFGGLAQVEEIKFRVSIERIFTGAQNAAQSPNKDIIAVENITLKGGAQFSANAFSASMGVPAECIAIDARDASAFELHDSVVEIKENIEVDIYAMCYLQECGENSKIKCVISFDKEINPDEW